MSLDGFGTEIAILQAYTCMGLWTVAFCYALTSLVAMDLVLLTQLSCFSHSHSSECDTCTF